MLNERTRIIIRLVLTQLILIPGVIFLSMSVTHDANLLLTISQSLIIILFLTGYWEFFREQFRLIYFVSMEVLLIAALWWRLSSGIPPENE